MASTGMRGIPQSPMADVISKVRQGPPDPEYTSTSYVERQNLQLRMAIRRLTRLTNGFSRKLVNLKAAVALHFAYSNMVRVHSSLRVTPAMEADLPTMFGRWPNCWEFSNMLFQTRPMGVSTLTSSPPACYRLEFLLPADSRPYGIGNRNETCHVRH